MIQKRCPKCNHLNEPGMNFCTSCGSSVSANLPSNTPTVEKVQVLPTTVKFEVSENKRKGNSKLWLAGILGCFGMVGIGMIGILALAWFSFPKGEISSNVKQNQKNIANQNGNSNNNIIKKTSPDSNELVMVLKDRPNAGKFRQVKVETVKTADYFPLASEAAQAIYHNGSRYVTIAIGKFDSFEQANKNFDEQFANVTKKGGTVKILETAADGTINGVHQTKGLFAAEYCTKSAFCYRIVSKDAKALKYFLENFVTL